MIWRTTNKYERLVFSFRKNLMHFRSLRSVCSLYFKFHSYDSIKWDISVWTQKLEVANLVYRMEPKTKNKEKN